jgi:hypothetical protein
MNELEQKMISSGWFSSGKTLGETIAQFESLGYEQDKITETVFDMHEWGILYTYPSKVGECYRLSIQAEPEFDIGV